MNNNNLKGMSLRTTLRLTTGVPLFLGIVTVVAVSLHLMTSNATGWMAPVVTSLENEETSSLQRLAVAQAGFAEEVVAQIFDEINLARDFATKILSYDFVKTNGTMPVNAYHYTLPLSVDSVGILEYDKNKIKTSPPPANRVCSTIVNQNNLKNCWFDPEIPLTSGRVIEGSTASPSGEKLTVSLRTTGVYWPHPKATGKMGPYMPGCEGDKYSTCTLDPSYEFKDINNLNTSIVEEIKMTSYLSDTFLQTFLSNEAIEFMYIGTHGHGVFRVFPYMHSAGRVTKDRQSARDGKTRIGYDPRHRPWYWQCEQAGKTIVTPPYIDATTDELVITVASPVYDKSTNKLLAVIGYDVSIARLANLILSAKVLFNGYAYLLTAKQGYTYSELGGAAKDDTGKLVVYPGLSAADIGSGNTNLFQWEFKDDAAAGNTFKNGVYKKLADPLSVAGASTYTKRGNLWHIAYAPVPTPRYTLAYVVPDSDIRVPASRVEKMINTIVQNQTILFTVFISMSIAAFAWMQIEVARLVVHPIQSLTRVIDLIIKDINRNEADARAGMADAVAPGKKKADGSKEGKFSLHVNDLIKPEDEGCKEVSMMKKSFEHMLMALRFGSESAAKNDLKAALAIYSEARTMFRALSNLRGEGIATFNLAVIYHKIWLQSDKMDMHAFANAKQYYVESVDNGNKIWNSLLRGDNDGNAVVPINPDGIEMTAVDGAGQKAAVAPAIMDGLPFSLQHQKSTDSSIDENAEVVIPKRLIGNDMADKLSARLHHYAHLLIDTAQAENYNLAKILLEQALALDNSTNNLLGYSSRVGLYGEALFGLGQYQVAEEKVMGQLNVLRNRVAAHQHAELTAEAMRNMSNNELKRTQSEQQENEEMFQAYQNSLFNAASMMANDPQAHHDAQALELFKEALTCSERSKLYTISQIFSKMKPLVDRNESTLSAKFKELFEVEYNKSVGRAVGGSKAIVFVVDYSGSMSGGKIRRARNGISSVIQKQMTSKDTGCVVRFSSDVKVMCELTDSESDLLNIVAGLTRPSRATALWDALGTAINILNKGAIQDPNVDPWIVCVSDGEDNKSRKFSPQKVGDLIRQHNINIVILSVGVTDFQAVEDMRLVASCGNQVGELIEIQSSEEIDDAFRTIETLVGGGLEVQHY